MGNSKSWSETAAAELRGLSVDDLTWHTLEGIAVQPLYTAEDTDGLAHLGTVPGQAPFTRGVKATMFWCAHAGLQGSGLLRSGPRCLAQVSSSIRSRRKAQKRKWPPCPRRSSLTRNAARGSSPLWRQTNGCPPLPKKGCCRSCASPKCPSRWWNVLKAGLEGKACARCSGPAVF